MMLFTLAWALADWPRAPGSLPLLALLSEGAGAPCQLVPVGCIGLDEEEVLVDVQLGGKERYSYGRMDIDRTRKVIDRHVLERQTR